MAPRYPFFAGAAAFGTVCAGALAGLVCGAAAAYRSIRRNLRIDGEQEGLYRGILVILLRILDFDLR